VGGWTTSDTVSAALQANFRLALCRTDALYDAAAWFDPIYQESKRKRGKKVWVPIPDGERFSNIINSALATSLVQVADDAAYVYRRHVELKSHTKIGKASGRISRAWRASSMVYASGSDQIELGRAWISTKWCAASTGRCKSASCETACGDRKM
jgi:hypothetical protein